MRFVFVFFLFLMILVLAASHLFIYAAAVKFFGIESQPVKRLLAAFVGFWGLSFFVASVLIHWRENVFSRGFYFLAGSWLGLAATFISIALVGFAVIFLSQKLGRAMDAKIIGWLAVLVSLIITAYGISNAARPQVKELAVKLDGLPENWRGKTVVQITDVHLGAVHRERFLSDIIDKINRLKPEAVLITGDYFDGMDGQLDEFALPLDRIEAAKGIYFVTGNHETYLGLDKVFAALAKTETKILDDEAVTIDGLTLVGISYPRFGQRKKLPEVLAGLNPSRPAILLYHEPRQIAAVARSGLVDLMLMGHTHDGQFWPIQHISRLIYGKFVSGLYQTGDLASYTSTGVGTWGPPLRTGNRPEIVAIKLEKR